MYSELTIVGRLGSDPSMRYLENGDPVTSFSVATDRTWKDKSGQTVKRTTWYRVSVWGKAAEACNSYLAKGRLVLVVGMLEPDATSGSPRVYQTKDGKYAASYEVRASEVKFLSPKENGESNGAAASADVEM